MADDPLARPGVAFLGRAAVAETRVRRPVRRHDHVEEVEFQPAAHGGLPRECVDVSAHARRGRPAGVSPGAPLACATRAKQRRLLKASHCSFRAKQQCRGQLSRVTTTSLCAGDGCFGLRMRALIVLLSRASLRISEALAVAERDLDALRRSVLVRSWNFGGNVPAG